MKIAVILLLIISVGNASYGQELIPAKLRHKDSIELTQTWRKFKIALVHKDTKSLHPLSLRLVYCDLFETPDAAGNSSTKDSYIPIDKFSREFFHHMSNSKLWLVVKNKSYHMTAEQAQDFRPRSIKPQKERSLTIYNIWYVTWEPNELAKGHEGQSHAFQFVKINGSFKFYGMTSIP